MAQWLTNLTSTVRTRVRSLAYLSGLRIWCCHELWCRLQMQLGSGVGPSYSSDLTPSLGTYAAGVALKKTKNKTPQNKLVFIQNQLLIDNLPLPENIHL